MAQPVARVGDSVSGTCTAHDDDTPFTGAIVTGSGVTSVEGSPVARVDDTGTTSCGHNFIITSGSAIFFCDGKAVARVGDTISVIEGGSGTITSGAANVSAN